MKGDLEIILKEVFPECNEDVVAMITKNIKSEEDIVKFVRQRREERRTKPEYESDWLDDDVRMAISCMKVLACQKVIQKVEQFEQAEARGTAH